jgi:ankyrin repeat protein
MSAAASGHASAILALYDQCVGGRAAANVPTALVCAIALSDTRDVAAALPGDLPAVFDALERMPFNARSIDLLGVAVDCAAFDRLVATLTANPRHGYVQRLRLNVASDVGRGSKVERLAPALSGCLRLRHLRIAHDGFFMWMPLFMDSARLLRTVRLNDVTVTALEKACAQGLEESVRIALRDPQWQIAHQESRPLLFAAFGGRVEVVRMLLRAGCSMTRVATNGRTALSLAAMQNEVEVVRVLIAAGADMQSRDGDGDAALPLAAFVGQLEAVRALVDGGANKDVVDDGGHTALILAAHNGFTDIVKFLVEAGCDREACTVQNHNTALLLAAQQGHRETVVYLLGVGCDAAATNLDADGAMTLAAHAGHAGMVGLLLERGFSANVTDDANRSPLLMAAGNNRTAVLRVLLLAGVDTEIRDDNGDTALTAAAHWGQVETVELLLKSGVDKTAQDMHGRNALMAASIEGGVAVTAVLLADGGIDVDARDRHGQTALMHAVKRGDMQIVRALLEGGCDAAVTDGLDLTALHHAKTGWADDIAALLQSYAASRLSSIDAPSD